MTCRCHSSDLYAGLVDCPKCGHRSLDRGESWEGCERRACGYERVLDQASLAAVLARTAPLLEERP